MGKAKRLRQTRRLRPPVNLFSDLDYGDSPDKLPQLRLNSLDTDRLCWPGGRPVTWADFAAWRASVAGSTSTDEGKVVAAIADVYDEYADNQAPRCMSGAVAATGNEPELVQETISDLIDTGFCRPVYRTPSGTTVVYMLLPDDAKNRIHGVIYITGINHLPFEHSQSMTI